MADLVARGISKRFPDRTVLDGIDLKLVAGAVTLVGGRSGSGKSTLFSILACLDRPTAGRVVLGDQDLTALSPDERARMRVTRMGIVFQDFRLIPDLNVVENVRLPMLLAGRRDRSRERAHALLHEVGLRDHWDAYPETLSGGEQQRAAVARALANDPEVVLADEPTANLDEANAHVVLRLLRSAARADRIVLVASHDPLARAYADVATELRDGRLAPLVRQAVPGTVQGSVAARAA